MLGAGRRGPAGRRRGSGRRAIGEIVDVAEIAGYRLGGGAAFEIVANQRRFSGPGLAQSEQVEPGTGDAGAKGEGSDGARLAQDFAEHGQVCGGFKIQAIRIANPSYVAGGELD